jgi:hypothetical protein
MSTTDSSIRTCDTDPRYNIFVKERRAAAIRGGACPSKDSWGHKDNPQKRLHPRHDKSTNVWLPPRRGWILSCDLFGFVVFNPEARLGAGLWETTALLTKNKKMTTHCIFVLARHSNHPDTLRFYGFFSSAVPAKLPPALY